MHLRTVALGAVILAGVMSREALARSECDSILVSRYESSDISSLSVRYAAETVARKSGTTIGTRTIAGGIAGIAGGSDSRSSMSDSDAASRSQLTYSIDHAREILLSYMQPEAIRAWSDCKQREESRVGLHVTVAPVRREQREVVLTIAWQDGPAPRPITLEAPRLPEGMRALDPPEDQWGTERSRLNSGESMIAVFEVSPKAVAAGRVFNIVGRIDGSHSQVSAHNGPFRLKGVELAPVIVRRNPVLQPLREVANCKYLPGEGISLVEFLVEEPGSHRPYLKWGRAGGAVDGAVEWSRPIDLSRSWLLMRKGEAGWVDLVVGPSRIRVAEANGPCRDGGDAEFWLEGVELIVERLDNPL